MNSAILTMATVVNMNCTLVVTILTLPANLARSMISWCVFLMATSMLVTTYTVIISTLPRHSFSIYIIEEWVQPARCVWERDVLRHCTKQSWKTRVTKKSWIMALLLWWSTKIEKMLLFCPVFTPPKMLMLVESIMCLSSRSNDLSVFTNTMLSWVV